MEEEIKSTEQLVEIIEQEVIVRNNYGQEPKGGGEVAYILKNIIKEGYIIVCFSAEKSAFESTHYVVTAVVTKKPPLPDQPSSYILN